MYPHWKDEWYYYDYSGMINIMGHITSSIIGNVFQHSDIMSMLEIPCLLIVYSGTVSNANTNCIWGNIFYGMAIEIYGAKLTSCLHRELLIDKTNCWEESGIIGSDVAENQYNNGDQFIATNINNPIFNINERAIIILESAVISTEFELMNMTESYLNNGSFYNPFAFRLVIVPDRTIMFLDVIINQTGFPIQMRFYKECINYCNQIYRNSLDHIHQLHLECSNISDRNAIITANEFIPISSVNYTLPSKILLYSSGEFYPGGILDINFTILDSYNNIINDWDENVSITFKSNDFNFVTIMDIIVLESGIYQCDICETGLFIQNARIDQSLNQSYTIIADNNDDILFVNNLSVTVIQCPSGYGLNKASSQCYECSTGECSITPSIEPCISCIDTKSKLNGVECIGGDQIVLARNYWIGFNFLNDQPILSQYCPSNYCNQKHNGLYLDLYESDKLCALNRDPTAPLCGKCKEGYSELYGSSNCGECNNHRYEIWVIFGICSILFTVLIVFMNGIPIQSKPGDERNKYSFSNFIFCCRKTFRINHVAKDYIMTSITKPILYYYQSVSFVLLNGGIFLQISAMAELFNFQLDFGEQNTSNVSGYCWIKGIDAKYEIISRAIIPIFCFMTLFIMMIIYAIKNYNLFGRKLYFGKSLVQMLLLTIGTICGISFKLISCRSLGDEYSVHFYFGSDKCYDLIWWISLFILIIFVAIFVALLIKLYMDHRNKNIKYLNDERYVLRSLVKSYNITEHWYWEMIMFSRRLIIAMFNIIIESTIAQNILFILIVIYLLLHIYCNPFELKQINILETICLCCLLFILHILKDGNDDDDDDTFTIILLNIFIILPLITFIVQWIMIAGPYEEINENDIYRSDIGGVGGGQSIIPVGGRTPAQLSQYSMQNDSIDNDEKMIELVDEIHDSEEQVSEKLLLKAT